MNGNWASLQSLLCLGSGEDDQMATYLRLRVDGAQVTGDVDALGTGAQAVDHFP